MLLSHFKEGSCCLLQYWERSSVYSRDSNFQAITEKQTFVGQKLGPKDRWNIHRQTRRWLGSLKDHIRYLFLTCHTYHQVLPTVRTETPPRLVQNWVLKQNSRSESLQLFKKQKVDLNIHISGLITWSWCKANGNKKKPSVLLVRR